MDAGSSPISFLFDQFRLDRRGGLFRCIDGAAPMPVNIGSRALEVLMIQGCSMLSTEAPVGQGIKSSESGGVSVLTEGAGSVTA